MKDTFITITKDDLGVTLTDTLTRNDGTVQNLTGCTVKFRMREVTSSVLKVDAAAAITDIPGGSVAYSWILGDTNTEGEYRGWWRVTFANTTTLDSPEFKIIIDAHAPGTGINTGAIAEQVRQIMPVTWNALSDDNRYGDRLLQGRIDAVKFRLFATVVTPVTEATAYNPLILDYVAKVSALQIIPAGIDFWMEQHISQATSGGAQESVSYPDRVAALEKTHTWLTEEVIRLRPELDNIFAIRKKGNYPKVSDTGALRTPDPQRFPKQTDLGFGLIDDHTTLPWSPF